MAQPLDAEGQRTPVTMDDDITQPEHITEAEREELARLLVREPVLMAHHEASLWPTWTRRANGTHGDHGLRGGPAATAHTACTSGITCSASKRIVSRS